MSRLNKFVDLVKLLRPKFYNTLTWTMVISGIGMMSNSLWVGIVNGIAEKFFEVSIVDTFTPIYGLFLIVFALCFNSANLHLDRKAELTKEGRILEESTDTRQAELEHDRELYKREVAILGQNEVDYFYDYVGANHCYVGDHVRCLAEFHDFSILTENRYFNESVLLKRDDLAKVCRRLSEFISKHFFVFPNYKIGDHFQYTMYPDLNIDRGGSGDPVQMARYDKYADELLELLKELRSSYASYRLSIKKAFTI